MSKKQILLLSDTKAGHQNQSRALIKELEYVAGLSGEETSLLTNIIQIKFKSRLRERFFSVFTIIIYPFINKGIPLLGLFLEKDTIPQIKAFQPDIIISAGSGMVPCTLLLSKIHRAKRIVLMRPAFPLSLFAYDLVIVPKHDAGLKIRGSLERVLALSPFDGNLIKLESENLKNRLSKPGRAQIGILIGGNSKNYKFNKERMNLAIEQIISACKSLDVDFIATTCRRTPQDYEAELSARLKNTSNCSLLILSNKETATNVVSAMIGLCKVLIATEESISMISEPINAGKKTVVLKLNEKIYHKYARFHKIAFEKGLIHISKFDQLADKIIEVYRAGSYDLDEKGKSMLKEERQSLRERLKRLL